MYFNIKQNNYKNDKLVKMQIRNEFRVNGYWAYFMIRQEKGEDLIIQEYYDNDYNTGFFIKSLVPDFNFETSNIFDKFGITIPNNITFLMQIDDFNTKKTELEGNGYNVSFPEEGDLIFLVLQNKLIDGKNLAELEQETLSDLLLNADNSMNFLFEVTDIDKKQFVFNGQSYYYKFTCEVFKKKVSATFSGDLDIVDGKIDNDVVPNDDTNPTENTENFDDYYDKYTDTMDNLLDED
jgi:hypothetical protein